jgi:hypothetical protein
MSYRLWLALGCAGLLAVFGLGCVDMAGGSTSGSQVTLTVMDTADFEPMTPAFIAFQDGVDGPWQAIGGQTLTRAVAVPSTGVYRADVTDPAGAYSFAVVVEGNGGVRTYLLRGTLAEGTTVTLPVYIPMNAFTRGGRLGFDRTRASATRFTSTWTLDCTLTNAPGGVDSHGLSSPAYYRSDPGTSGTQSIPMPAGQTADGVVLLYKGDASPYRQLLYLLRDQNQPGGTTVPVTADFSLPCNYATKHTIDLTLDNPSTLTVAGATATGVNFITANSTYVTLNNTQSNTVQYPLLPSEAVVAGDRYQLLGADDTRLAMVYSHAGTATVTLPSVFTPTYDDGAPLTMAGLSADGQLFYTVGFADTNNHTYEGYVTSGWLTAADATSITVPDLSSLTGWDADWNLGSLSNAYAIRTDYGLLTLSELLTRYFAFGTPHPAPADGAYFRDASYTMSGE